MSFKKSIWGLALALTCVTANASTISGNLADDSARVNVGISFEPFVFEGGAVYASDGGQSIFGGVLLESKSEPIELGIGARVRVVEAELGGNDSGYSFGFGGYYRFILPMANRFNFFLSAYYYPELLSYGNILRQYETSARAEYLATENVGIYLGYDLNAIDYKNREGTFRLEEDVNIGVAVYF